MNILNNIFKVLSWIVAAAIIIFIMIAVPVIAGYKPVIVLSGSMEPSYHVGCITYYHSCDFNDLQVGDTITFEASGAMVTHRIIKINGLSGNVETKGDNNPTQDPEPVEASDIVGKTVDFQIPFAGYFVAYGKKPMTIAVMVQILLINYLLEKLSSSKERRRGHETDKK